eukprot:scaffold45280_cov16-Tisochrysis_lutea.AAC.1
MGPVYDHHHPARPAAWGQPHHPERGVVQALQQQVSAHGALQPASQQELECAVHPQGRAALAISIGSWHDDLALASSVGSWHGGLALAMSIGSWHNGLALAISVGSWHDGLALAHGMMA